MDLYVRNAEQKDIPRILELLVEVDMVHHEKRPDIFKGPATKYNAEQLSEIISNSRTPVFVCADEQDVPLGHAFCIAKQEIGNSVLTDIKTLYIDDICVHSKARGKGVGKRLFDHTAAYAKANGFYNITLNVWSCNESALGFYEAMGLVPQKIGMEMIL